MLKLSWRLWVLAILLAGRATYAQTAIPPSPTDFFMMASQSDRYEVLAAETAAAQSQDSRVKVFAREMIEDHTRLSDAMRKAAVASKLPASEQGISSDQGSLLGSLQSLRGVVFDKAYARQQVLAHAQAVAIEESFATGGSDQNLQKAAQAALPSTREHLKKARQLKRDIGDED